jgi:competence protein ComEA
VPDKAALVNINTADEAKLSSLKGIGSTKAKAITTYRQEHGPFK